jgi:hypothetical protein
MVVGKEDPGAAELRRVGNDLTDREGGAGLVSDMAAKVQAAQLIVDVGDPQILPRGIGICETAGEEFPRRGEAVELEREFGTLIPHGREATRSRIERPFQPSSDRRGSISETDLPFRPWTLPDCRLG